MNQLALAVAVAAAVAILLITFAIASSRGSSIGDRLERYASTNTLDSRKVATGQGGVAELIAQSEALNSLNRVVESRDFGANLARDLARADLRLKPSEFLLIWGAAIIGVPLVMFAFSPFFPTLGNPFFLLIGLLMGFLLPRFWLARRKSGRL